MEGTIYQESEKGAPQGGLISPVLANVYLQYENEVREVMEQLKARLGKFGLAVAEDKTGDTKD